MMRLPPFRWHAPKDLAEVVRILAGEGPAARVVAGGTDLFPNMKRRHQKASTLVGLAGVEGFSGVNSTPEGAVVIGAGTTLRALERDATAARLAPALGADRR